MNTESEKQIAKIGGVDPGIHVSNTIIQTACDVLKARGDIASSEHLGGCYISSWKHWNVGEFWNKGVEKFNYLELSIKGPVNSIEALREGIAKKRSVLSLALEESLNAHGMTSIGRDIRLFVEPTSFYDESYKGIKITKFNGVCFRSGSEVRIAEILEKRSVMFFANSRGRMGGVYNRKTREPDFIVCVDGKWGMLEVDGPHHDDEYKELDRDELFAKHGVALIAHYDSDLCDHSPEKVVDDFLERLNRSKQKPNSTNMAPVVRCESISDLISNVIL